MAKAQAVDSTPTEIVFIKWATPEDSGEEDGGNEEEEQVLPGSLKEILDGIANAKTKAVNGALMNKSFTFEEGRRIINETSKPFLQTMDEARQKFVDDGKLAEEEAKAILGVDDYTKKETRESRRHLQKALNKIRGKGILQYRRWAKVLTKLELQQQITETSKPFEERIDKCRAFYEKNRPLTAEEVKAITPTIGNAEEDSGRGENDEGPKGKDKDAENNVAAPSRVVPDKGFPVTKLGWQKFVELKREVDKRDQDLHGMYIYIDFTGYGIKELAEFDTVIFKKDISPVKKWAIVEALTLYLRMGGHILLMMTDDSEGTSEVLDMLGIMSLTALEMLYEIGSIGTISPLRDNIAILTLFFLNFMLNVAIDFKLRCLSEIVRTTEAYDIALTPSDKVGCIDHEEFDIIRQLGKFTKKAARISWKTGYPKFKRKHPGGNTYDITLMPEKKRASHKFGNMGDDDSNSDTDSHSHSDSNPDSD
ncbi:SAP domain-containing isoform 1 protein [Rutstroemia sp. NJR-2017a WRK4]|nr:SAP domain-containing isoform 1 protein [Rutstroemia sp. NJR-2017a WRK4]